jgi:hypothetical protein
MRRRTINLDDRRALRRLLPRRRQSAAQLRNLRPPSHRPWQAGVSGNPRGHRLGSRYGAPDRPVGQRPEVLAAEEVARGVQAVLAEREARAERRQFASGSSSSSGPQAESSTSLKCWP